MADALKIGIAGLGTVGASLVRIIQQTSNELAVTCGRPINITAVSARDKARDRGIDLIHCYLVRPAGRACRKRPISTSSSS